MCVEVVLWKRTTSSQCGVWGKRSTGTATTGVKGVPLTLSDGLLQRLCVRRRERDGVCVMRWRRESV